MISHNYKPRQRGTELCAKLLDFELGKRREEAWTMNFCYASNTHCREIVVILTIWIVHVLFFTISKPANIWPAALEIRLSGVSVACWRIQCRWTGWVTQHQAKQAFEFVMFSNVLPNYCLLPMLVGGLSNAASGKAGLQGLEFVMFFKVLPNYCLLLMSVNGSSNAASGKACFWICDVL